MTEVAVAYMPVVPTFKGVKKTIENAIVPTASAVGTTTGTTMGNRITSGLKRSAKVAGVAMAGVLGTSLVKGFQRLSAIENAEKKLEGLGNSAADTQRIMDNALAAVKGTAFGMDEAATAAASAVAAGVKPGQELESYLRLVGDAATIAGTDMSSMGAIFGKVMTSGKVQGDVFAQLHDSGIPIVTMLAESMGKSADEIYKMGSAGQISSAQFLEAMGSISGAALKGGETTTGAWKNMVAALSRFGAGLLKGVYPLIGPMFNTITQWLDVATEHVTPLAEALSVKLGDALRPTAEAMKEFFSRLDFSSWDAFQKSLTGGSGKVQQVFGRIGDSLKRLQPAFTEFMKQLPAIGGAAVQIGAAGLEAVAKVLGFLADHVDVIIKLMPFIVAGFVAWRVASLGLAVSSQKLQWAQLAMAPVMLTNNALRLTSIVLENQATKARLRQTGATKRATLAQRIFNGAMRANPIGLIITAIMALIGVFVLAYKNVGWFRDRVDAAWTHIKDVISGFTDWWTQVAWPWIQQGLEELGGWFTWLWQEIIVPAWDGIAAAITWAWNNVIKPIWDVLVWVIQNVLVPVFTFLWETVKWVWDNVGAAIQWAWNNVIKPIWDGLVWAVRNILVPVFTFLWDTVKWVWDNVGAAIQWAWNNVIKPIWEGLKWYITTILVPTFTNLWEHIKKTWDWIGDKIQKTKDWIQDKILSPLSNWIETTFVDSWTRTKDGIKKAWEKLKEAVKEPVRFVVNHVVNPFIGGYNKLNDFWHGDDLEKIKIEGFARGGVLPGHQSAKRDDLLVPMRSGEGVLVPEVVRGIGEDTIHRLNAAGNTGGTSAVRNLWSREYGAAAAPADRADHAYAGAPPGGPSGGLWGSIQSAMSRAGRLFVPDTRVRGISMADAAKAWMGQSALEVIIGNGYPRVRPHVGHRGPWGFADTSGNLEISTTTPANRGLGVAIHELGHILSLQHPAGGYRATGSVMSAGMAGGDWPTALDYAVLRRVWGDPGKGVKKYTAADVGAQGQEIDAVGWLREKLEKWITGPIKDATSRFSDNSFLQMPIGIAKSAFDSIINTAASFAGPLLNGVSDAVSGTVDRAKVTKWATDALIRAGHFSPGNLTAAVNRAFKESSGDPSKVNNWDSNAKAGHPTKGLMQMREDTFLANAHPGRTNIFDPIDNLLASINYTLKRYGSLTAGWNRKGGYALGGIIGGRVSGRLTPSMAAETPTLFDRGGILDKGITLIDHQRNTPDYVLTDEHWETAYKSMRLIQQQAQNPTSNRPVQVIVPEREGISPDAFGRRLAEGLAWELQKEMIGV